MNIIKSKSSYIGALLSFVLIHLAFISIASAEVFEDDEDEPIVQKIIIQNVTFLDPSGEKEPAVANVIISGKLFELVTLDEVEVAPSDIIFDAQNGFLLGTLEPGKPASFLILSEDPHKNIEALLDTKKHILLAIRDGIIIRNNLKKESSMSGLSDHKKSKTKRAGWLAYTPPTNGHP